jgi:hypothetical protein
MGPGAMMNIPDLIEIGSAIQKLMRGIHRYHRLALVYLFQNKERRVKVSLFLHVNTQTICYR